jgi:disulfide oxidoreductase YuzD
MNLKNLSTATIAMITSIFIFSCSGGNMPEEKVTFPSIKDVSASSWEKLAQKKIYFGHQSVGFNIIDGINDVMKEHSGINVNIVETADESNFKVGLLAHSRVGKNVDPKSKITEFANFIDSGIGKKADAAALKFCYVDITAGTNANNVFNVYSDSILQLKAKYPDMIIIHFTNPLTQRQTGLKTWIKKVIGRPIGGVDDNIKRNEYNEMLIKLYEGKEPIFDIAKIQSTFPDGTRCSFSKDGKTYYSMVPEYTTDGGHLNETGRKKVAEQFLILLANL